MKNENSVMAILAAAVGALCSYAAALVVPLAVLLAVMVVVVYSGIPREVESHYQWFSMLSYCSQHLIVQRLS